MDITISSVTTMCLLNSVLITIVCLLFRTDFIMKKLGPKCMILVFLTIVVRMFLPLEFPFTYSLRIEDILTPLRRIFTYGILKDPVELLVWHGLIVIWVVGIVFFLIQKSVVYGRCLRTISLLEEQSWEDICARYQFDITGYEDLRKIRFVFGKYFTSPYLLGLGKHYLVMPEKEYSNEEFRYIVLHELMHVRNKDILWKVLIDLLCVAFWWNPIIYWMKRELSRLIEMRNDMQIFSVLEEDQKVGYMKCLKSTAEELAGRDMAFGVSFNRSDLKELEKRMKMMLTDGRYSRSLQVTLAILIGVLLLGTSAVVLEPFSTDKIEEELTILSDSNTYLVANDGKYDVYVDGEYFFSTSDIESFRDVEIYNNLEEVKEDD